jgi:hypothetical protein
VLRRVAPLDFTIREDEVGKQVLVNVEIEQQTALQLPDEVVVLDRPPEELMHLQSQDLDHPPSLFLQPELDEFITEALDGGLELLKICLGRLR